MKRAAAIARSEGDRQMQINQAQGEAEAVVTVANATAEAIKKVVQAIQEPGGMSAVNLQVAENYISAFSQLAQRVIV